MSVRSVVALAALLILGAGCSSPDRGPDRASGRAVDTLLSGASSAASTKTATSLADSTLAATTAPPTTVSPTTSSIAPPTAELDTFESAWKPVVEGLLTFRGNPNRRFYGAGPVPTSPAVAWTYPKSGAMCRSSTAEGETKQWCGAGWTGQPTVHVRDGRTWLVFNAYDGAVHFVDAATGDDILEPFVTGDIIKGTVTIDPDGFPIVYSGSRDNFFRALAIDRDGQAVELWRLSADAVSPTKWNNDWDGSALVLGDYLIEGGENSQLHVVKLNRAYDADGLVTVDPTLVFNTPGWDDQLLRDLAGRSPSEVSIENSVAVDGDIVYFGNSGGLVQGWDLAPLRTGGTPTRTFRYWMGDDTDASVVIDDDGFLYVGAEYERETSRSRDVGQLVKLDPKNPENPLVWSFADHGRVPSGIWSTVAIDRGVVVTTTNGGRVVGLDQLSGAILWEFALPAPLWQSPVIVGETLIQGDCAGQLHGYDLRDPRSMPAELWSVSLGGCIEATPAVWKGAIYVATRGGRLFAIRDRPS
jgi:outer membrane protein assembly factor BamB